MLIPLNYKLIKCRISSIISKVFGRLLNPTFLFSRIFTADTRKNSGQFLCIEELTRIVRSGTLKGIWPLARKLVYTKGNWKSWIEILINGMSREGRVGRQGKEEKEEWRDCSSIERIGLISIHPFYRLSRFPHQLSPLSLFPVRRAPPSALSLDSSSSQRRPAGLSLGPGCHARGHRRFLREVVPAAGAGQSSPLVTTLPADAPGERAVPRKAGHPNSFRAHDSRDRINYSARKQNFLAPPAVLEISLGAFCNRRSVKYNKILKFLWR